MSQTFQTNDKRFQDQLYALQDALSGNGKNDACALLEDQARLFLKSAIKITPPAKGRADAENAIKKSVSKVFTSASEDFLISEFGSSGAVDQWFTNARNQKVHAKFDYLDINGDFMERFFQGQRIDGVNTVKRPRVKYGELWAAKYVVSNQSLELFIKRIQARLGMMKCGWFIAYDEVGGKVPSWISRHKSKPVGSVINNLATKKPSIVMTNRASGIAGHQDIMNRAFQSRISAIRIRIKLLVSNYSDDVRKKVRVKRHATKTAGSEVSE